MQVKRLQGVEDHLHVDEIKLRDDGLLLQCSYTFGVVDTTDPVRMDYLSQNLKHTIPDDERTPGCIHLGWEGDLVFTTHRGNIRNPAYLSGWDLTDPEVPVQLPVLQEPGISYEGVDAADGYIYAALHENGLGIYSLDAQNQFVRVGTGTEFENAWGVVVRDQTVFVADGVGGLVTVDVADPTNPVTLGQVTTGGQARDIVLDGNLAYVAAGSAGLMVVDISDLASPEVIASVPMPGTALRVAYAAGHVFVAAWNDARVYAVSNPEEPRFVAAARMTQELGSVTDPDRPASTSRVMGIAARDNDVFIGNWHVLYSYRLYPERTAPNLRLPEAVSMLDFGPVEAGESATVSLDLTNQGTAPLTVIGSWVEGEAFSVTPSQLRIPPGRTAKLSLTYTARAAETESGLLQIMSDDPVAPVRQAFLIGNQPGISVGSVLPETTATLLDGTTWSSKQAEADGQVVLLEYFATFCPVCGGVLPDLEERFWQKYKDKGLAVVALNAHDTAEQVGQVEDYCQNLRLSFPIGLEIEKTTYQGITENFAGLNPFPVDVLIGKDGKVAYIAREYDPDAMTEIVERLLAE
ncbi:MAG TPA: redoxin family protein [Polyangiaceae bacterium]|nr:redoxin family protein [Polyangiaceae bacterium]